MCIAWFNLHPCLDSTCIQFNLCVTRQWPDLDSRLAIYHLYLTRSVDSTVVQAFVDAPVCQCPGPLLSGLSPSFKEFVLFELKMRFSIIHAAHWLFFKDACMPSQQVRF